MYASFPPSLWLGVGGPSHSNFLASAVNDPLKGLDVDMYHVGSIIGHGI